MYTFSMFMNLLSPTFALSTLQCTIICLQQGCSTPPPRPAKNELPRPAPPCKKQALPRPAPQKLTKPAGRNRAKLTIDFTEYAHTFGLRVVKWRQSFSFGLLYSLWLSGLQKDHLKSENVMFSLIKTPYCNTNPPVTIYALLSNF